VELR